MGCFTRFCKHRYWRRKRRDVGEGRVSLDFRGIYNSKAWMELVPFSFSLNKIFSPRYELRRMRRVSTEKTLGMTTSRKRLNLQGFRTHLHTVRALNFAFPMTLEKHSNSKPKSWIHLNRSFEKITTYPRIPRTTGNIVIMTYFSLMQINKSFTLRTNSWGSFRVVFWVCAEFSKKM